jgi:hypothetical protein
MRDLMISVLEKQIIADGNSGDTTVLYELLDRFSDKTIYNALADTDQGRFNLPFKLVDTFRQVTNGQYWTKKQLLDILKDFEDRDQIVINVHDYTLDEDNYNFNIDPIHMGLDDESNDRGHQIQLCPIPHPSSLKGKFVLIHKHKHGTDSHKFRSSEDWIGWWNEENISNEDYVRFDKIIKKLKLEVDFDRGESIEFQVDSQAYVDID